MKVEKPFFNLGANIRTSYLRPDLFPVREATSRTYYFIRFVFSRTPIVDTKSPPNNRSKL